MKVTNKQTWYSNLKSITVLSLMLISSAATAQLEKVELTSLNLKGSIECTPYTENFNITLKNTSTVPVTNIPVMYLLIYEGFFDYENAVLDTVYDTIPAGASIDFTFTTPATMTGDTSHYIQAVSNNFIGTTSIQGGSIVTTPGPESNFTLVKNGSQVEVNALEGNDYYNWDFGDGTISDQEDATHTYSNVDQGTFTICLVTEKSNCLSEECKDVTIDLVGIRNLTVNNNMINVYPNPTTGRFNISIENPTDVTVKVGNILGNTVEAGSIDNYNGTYSIDLSNIADGVYYVQVKNGEYFATKKIKVSK